MATRRHSTTKITIELPVGMAADIDALVERTAHCDDRGTSHGALTMEKLAKMLLEDAAMTVGRPGSWEASNMDRVLQGHGYDL